MAATALIIAGGGLMAYGQLKEGQIAAAEGRFAQKIGVANLQAARANQKAIEDSAAANNAALERQAKAEREAASLEEERVARKEKIVKGAARAAAGKSGVGLAGATLGALTDIAFQFSLERNLTLRGGLIRARELLFAGQMELFKGKVLGGQELFKGQLAYAQGKWAATMGREAQRLSYFKAGATILATAYLAGETYSGGGTTTMSSANTSSGFQSMSSSQQLSTLRGSTTSNFGASYW